MDLYTPVLALAGLATGFAVLSVAVSALVGPRRYNQAKISSYECGVEASPRAQRGERIPVRYYTVAMTFIIFDIEIMFMIPWAVHFDELGVFEGSRPDPGDVNLPFLHRAAPLVAQWDGRER